VSFKDTIDSDLGVMLSADEFGITATFTPKAGGGDYPVDLIFDKDAVEVPDEEGNVFIRSNKPNCRVRLSDFTVEPVYGDGFTIDGTDYTIEDIEPDESGQATIWLHLKDR